MLFEGKSNIIGTGRLFIGFRAGYSRGRSI